VFDTCRNPEFLWKSLTTKVVGFFISSSLVLDCGTVFRLSLICWLIISGPSPKGDVSCRVGSFGRVALPSNILYLKRDLNP
jgi:hypothetical protein